MTRFIAEIVDENLVEGFNMLVNWGQAGVGAKTLQDRCEIYVQKFTQ